MSSLTPPRLDDVSFADLRSGAIERIPVESNGRWTLHAPVDPGITFLELLAYLLDQRLYRLDRAPDELVRALLRLLGQSVAPAGTAATVLRLLDATVPPRAIPAGARFDLRDRDIAFTTAEGVQVLPVRRVGVEVDGTDRSGDLAAGRPVAVVGALRIVLYLDGDPVSAAGGRAALLLRVDAPVEPQWLATTNAPPPAVLRFAHHAGAFPEADIEDGTAGLRRSGILRFTVPAGWQPDGPPQPDGAVPYSVSVSVVAPTYTSPPRLVQIVPNVAVARHRAAGLVPGDLEAQVSGWLPLPGRELDLGAAGTLAGARLALRERDGAWHAWSPADDFSFAGPGHRVYVVDRERGVLRFGDGLTGRIPVPHADAPRVRVTFEVGAGALGNTVGPAGEWDAPGDPLLTAGNVVAPEGGADAETPADARERAAESLLLVERAVTARDHETLAETTPGVDVARARAAVGFHPTHPCDPVPGAVTVFVVPGAPRDDFDDPLFVGAPQADPGLLAAVSARLTEARLLAGEVFVAGPRYRTVNLAVTVAGQPPDPERLRHAIAVDLRRFLDPLAGGDESGGWPFGDPLRPSALLRRAQDAVGTGAQVISVAIGLDAAPPEEDCAELAIGANDLVVLGSVALHWTPFSDRGVGLR